MHQNNQLFSIDFPNRRWHKYDSWINYPDIFSYSFKKQTYIDYWSGLSLSKGYLIAEDSLVKRVGWFRMAWETVKGWFGLTNHCEPSRIQMAFRKTLYFGYLHEINEEIHISDEFNLPQEYINISKQPKNDFNSSIMQTYLLEFYNQKYGKTGNEFSFFGQSYLVGNQLNDEDATKLFKIDPQPLGRPCNILIEAYCKNGNYEKVYQLIEGYLFTNQREKFDYYNRYLLENTSAAMLIRNKVDVFNQWLDYLSSLLVTNALKYREVIVSNPDHLKTALSLAYKFASISNNDLKTVIQLAINYSCYEIATGWLALIVTTDADFALNCIITNHAMLIKHIVPNSELAVLYAEKIIERDSAPVNLLFDLFNVSGRRITTENYYLAGTLNTALLFSSEKVAKSYFSQLIKDKRWTEAWNYYSDLREHKSIQLNTGDLKALSVHFEQEGNEFFYAAEQLKGNADCLVDAIKLYKLSIRLLIDSKVLDDTQVNRVKLNDCCYALSDLLLSQQPKKPEIYNEANELFELMLDNHVSNKSSNIATIGEQLREYAYCLAQAPRNITPSAPLAIYPNKTVLFTARPQFPPNSECFNYPVANNSEFCDII